MKKERVAYRGFKSSKALECYAVDAEFAAFIVKEVKRLFPYRRTFKPKIVFVKGSGPFGRRGEAWPHTQTIKLFKHGQNLETLLHEIAHLLAPRTPGQWHNKDFYYTCDMLEKALFSTEY